MTQLEPTEVEVRRAATVMLVRDGNAGLEVFMLRRNPASVFVGGAFVFPGGAVDQDDHHPEVATVCGGLTDPVASSLLGVERDGLAFWVAAIRECFEESGVLLAYDRNGSMVRFDDPDTEHRFAEYRQRVDAGQISMADLCGIEGLTLACDAIHYFSHWITPVGPPRRYDTRFFVAQAPDAQEGLHDDRETVANLWVHPTHALERAEAGELEIIHPTSRTLEVISRFDSASDVVSAARRSVDLVADEPRVVSDQGGTRIQLPGDPGYEGAAS